MGAVVKVRDIKKLEPLAECYHLPGAKAGGFLLIFVPVESSDAFMESIAEPNDDVLDGAVHFVNGKMPKIYTVECPLCKAFLECRNPDAEES